MFSAKQHRFIGSGQIGAVYDVDYNGTRCACKKFFESVCSAKAFEREAVLLADLRHPNIVQLIKVNLRSPLCIVTELLECSLHGLLHGKQGGAALRQLMLTPGMQSLKTDGLHVIIGPLPAGTKAKQLEVTVMPPLVTVRPPVKSRPPSSIVIPPLLTRSVSSTTSPESSRVSPPAICISPSL